MSQQTQVTLNADSLLDELDTPADPLEDLFQEAALAHAAKNPKTRKAADPSLRNALDAASKTMRELYTLPENWKRSRGVALIDKATQTLVGNFSEYVHVSLKNVRRLVREHTPIPIDATEQVEGYLGAELERRIRGNSWTTKQPMKADLWMDELMVGAPAVEVTVCLHLGAISRVELDQPTQFASVSGSTIMTLPQGTNVYEQLSTDTRSWLKKQTSVI